MIPAENLSQSNIFGQSEAAGGFAENASPLETFWVMKKLFIYSSHTQTSSCSVTMSVSLLRGPDPDAFHYSRPQFPPRKSSLPERLCFHCFVHIHWGWGSFQWDVIKTVQMFISNKGLNGERLLIEAWNRIVTSVLTHKWKSEGLSLSGALRASLTCHHGSNNVSCVQNIEQTAAVHALWAKAGPPHRHWCTHIKILQCPCWEILGQSLRCELMQSNNPETLLSNDKRARARGAKNGN